MKACNIARLTDSEKAALRLLASGHDTKSAATLLRISTHAVNERLRDARRKLEVTSSREAARQLAAYESHQEIRDRFSGAEFRSNSLKLSSRQVLLALVVGGFSVSVIVATVLLSSVAANNAPPRVVEVSPSPGSVIEPGPFILRIRFDQPMRDRSWSIVQVSRQSFPECRATPNISRDGRTFTVQCRAEAARSYELWFNRSPYLNFKGVNGRSAEPFQLRFRTTGGG